jgi:Tol biopolymer transport system component
MLGSGAESSSASCRLVLLIALGITAWLASADFAGATAPVGSNGKIAYNRAFGGQNDVFTANADGTGVVNLTNTGGSTTEAEPAFSPTGARIAFALCTSGGCDIAAMNPDGSGVTNLTNTQSPVNEERPAYSPDGARIAFDRRTPNEQQIWIMNADGSGATRLTNQPYPANQDFQPDFSPDGTSIVFTRCVNPGPAAQCDLWAMNVDGSNARDLTNTANPNNELGGSFSPDGRQIVFQFDDGNDDLGMMNADGSNLRILTDTTPAGERRPVFSGDGTRLAFSFDDGVTPQFDIYTSDLNAQNQFNVTKTFAGGETESNPDWEDVQNCRSSRATIVGDDGPDRLLGTKRRDVVDANATTGGKNIVKSKGGNDLICVGAGKAKVNCGKGKKDKVISQGKGKRKVKNCEITKGKGFKKPAK